MMKRFERLNRIPLFFNAIKMQMFDISHFYTHFTKLDPAVELLQVLMYSQGNPFQVHLV